MPSRERKKLLNSIENSKQKIIEINQNIRLLQELLALLNNRQRREIRRFHARK